MGKDRARLMALAVVSESAKLSTANVTVRTIF